MLGTLKGHTLAATTQGLLWKQDLKSRLKIPQRGEYVKIKISHVKLHKKIGVFHFGIKNKKHHQQPIKLIFFTKMSFYCRVNNILWPLTVLKALPYTKM